jgi:hypothetical protein
MVHDRKGQTGAAAQGRDPPPTSFRAHFQTYLATKVKFEMIYDGDARHRAPSDAY